MNAWPNWVDLLVVIIVFRTCYVGFARGVITEALALMGAISATALTLNYARVVSEWDTLALWPDSTLKAAVLFWALFVLLALAIRVIVKRAAEVIKWERVHWSIQSIGGTLGAVRGLWWSGFLLVAFSSSGVTALQGSVEERSVVGKRWLRFSRAALGQVADRFPGGRQRGEPLVPPVVPGDE